MPTSLLIFVASAVAMFGQGAAAIPVGAVRIAVAGGTSSTPSNTAFAVPLTDAPVNLGGASAHLVAITKNSITLGNATWTPGAFAPGTRPYAVRFLDGAAAGLVLPITASTTDTLTLRGPDLTGLGLATGSEGNAVELLQYQTLDSLFGATTFIGGTSAATADIITIGTYTPDRYYYNTTAGEWRRTNGPAIGRGGILIPPNGVIEVARIGSAMTLTFLGRAPSTPFRANVLRSGNTVLPAGFPTDVTLRGLAVQALISDWGSATDAASADGVSIAVDGAYVSFFFNGTNWVRAASPATLEDDRVISAGSAILITRRGTEARFTPLVRALPYSL